MQLYERSLLSDSKSIGILIDYHVCMLQHNHDIEALILAASSSQSDIEANAAGLQFKEWLSPSQYVLYILSQVP